MKFEKPSFSLDEAAQLLGIGKTLLWKLEKSGKLKIAAIGRRRFVLATELEKFFAVLAKGGAK